MAKILTIVVKDQASLHSAAKLIDRINLDKPLIVTVEEETKKRTRSQNDMHWAGLLGDFSSQARLAGRLFSEAVWHELLKEKFLPDAHKEGVTLKGYVKWLEMPDGRLKMIGSTTKLTTSGFSDYLEQCYAFGCDLDVRFTANPRDY